MQGIRDNSGGLRILISNLRSLILCVETSFGWNSSWQKKSKVEQAKFSGEMCAIAKGSASILFESLEGMTPEAITDISDNQVLENLGGPIQSSRVKCALLPINALRGAFQNAPDRPL